jgi:hypothetical protein
MNISPNRIFKTQNPTTLKRLVGAVTASDIDISPVEVNKVVKYLLLHRKHK